MSRRAAAALIALAALVAVFGGLWLGRTRPQPDPVATTAGLPTVDPTAPPAPWQATLWMPTDDGLLGPFGAEISSSPDLEARMHALLSTLLSTPATGELEAVFPEPVRSAAQVVGADGTLYVDLRRESGGPPPGAGSTLETQRVYSIVHTVLRNEPKIARVVLLWNGVQRESLSGHVDTGRPLALRPELEAR